MNFENEKQQFENTFENTDDKNIIVTNDTNSLNIDAPKDFNESSKNPGEINNNFSNASSLSKSKPKIHTALKNKIKSINPKLKKTVLFVLICIICFGLGILTDRTIVKHQRARILDNKNIIREKIPNNNAPFNKKNRNWQ